MHKQSWQRQLPSGHLPGAANVMQKARSFERA